MRGCCTFFGVVCVVVVMSGCASDARYVSLEPDGGVVAIPNNSNYWPTYYRDQAVKLIEKKCPTGYEIVREQEVVVGRTEHVHVNTETSGDPLLASLRVAPIEERTTETTSFSDKTEWRIWFRKK